MDVTAQRDAVVQDRVEGLETAADELNAFGVIRRGHAVLRDNDRLAGHQFSHSPNRGGDCLRAELVAHLGPADSISRIDRRVVVVPVGDRLRHDEPLDRAHRQSDLRQPADRSGQVDSGARVGLDADEVVLPRRLEVDVLAHAPGVLHGRSAARVRLPLLHRMGLAHVSARAQLLDRRQSPSMAVDQAPRGALPVGQAVSSRRRAVRALTCASCCGSRVE